jgi:hypothetical protein
MKTEIETFELVNNEYFYTTSHRLDPLYDQSINIHEFGKKCKEWALDEGFCLMSFIDFDGTWFCNISINSKSFIGTTEPEAIEKACLWVFENNNKGQE